MTEITENTVIAENTAVAESAEDNKPSLSLNDIAAAVKVIDFAADQGAFKGWTVIEQVLVVRNRLHSFLRAVTPEAPEGEGETEVAQAEVLAAE